MVQPSLRKAIAVREGRVGTLRAKALCLLPLPAAILTTPAFAREVKLEELRGATVSATIVYDQWWLRRGDIDRFDRFEYMKEFAFGPNDVVQVTWARTTLGRKGPKVTGTYAKEIGKVRTITAGHAVLVYLNGTLTEIQTGSKGGRKLEIKITRTPDGLACTARRLWMRETGAGSIVGVGRSPEQSPVRTRQGKADLPDLPRDETVNLPVRRRCSLVEQRSQRTMVPLAGSMLNPTNGASRFRLMILDACFSFKGRHFCE
jgi:hypothetical protein